MPEPNTEQANDLPWVLAGNRRQAEEFAREKGWGRDDWRYLHEAAQLLGVRSPTVYDVGTAYERPDYPLICNEITVRGGTIK